MKSHLLLICSLLLFFAFFILVSSNDHSEKNEEGPSDWFIAQRSYPYWKLDYHAYQIAVQKRAELASNNTVRDDLIWQLEGPYNIGGRVQDIEMDPTSFDVIYVGAASGGIFKSIDGGTTWTPIFDAQPSLSIGDI